MVLVAYPQFKGLLDEKEAEIARLALEIDRLKAVEKKALAFLSAGLEA
jgi:hypothetical protein